ncbi:hypothetical protein EJA01_03025 [Rhodovulum iodosum]|nr:hypothetical protein EJA01_03025 [Rhodovulum robiginosum]
MVSWTREVVETGAVSDVLGPAPIGYIAYHADGRMMATVFSRSRPAGTGAPLRTEQKARLFDTMLAYVAAYTLEEDRVIHHVEAAWNPDWEIDLSRPFTLDGDRLFISGAPNVDPLTGEDVLYRMEFTKV